MQKLSKKIPAEYSQLANPEFVSRDYTLKKGYAHLWGEAIADLEKECAFVLVGDPNIGKTKTVDYLIHVIGSPYLRIASDNMIICNYNEKTIVPYPTGDKPINIRKVIHMSREGESNQRDYVDQTLAFLVNELMIPKEEFSIIKNQPEETTKKLLTLLKS